MIEYYLPLRHAHVGLALLSGSLFALRGVLVLADRQSWARARSVRMLAHGIDTLLLAAALALLLALGLNPFASAWLSTKLLALVAYIVLGYYALGGTRPRAWRAVLYVAALACFGFMYSVARAHHPLGLFAGVAG